MRRLGNEPVHAPASPSRSRRNPNASRGGLLGQRMSSPHIWGEVRGVGFGLRHAQFKPTLLIAARSHRDAGKRPLTRARPPSWNCRTLHSLEEASRLTGVHPDLLHHYCQFGLLGEAHGHPDAEPVFDDEAGGPQIHRRVMHHAKSSAQGVAFTDIPMKRILVVDDDPSLCDQVAAMLQAHATKSSRPQTVRPPLPSSSGNRRTWC